MIAKMIHLLLIQILIVKGQVRWKGKYSITIFVYFFFTLYFYLIITIKIFLYNKLINYYRFIKYKPYGNHVGKDGGNPEYKKTVI
jgi:hypothetical protein